MRTMLRDVSTGTVVPMCLECRWREYAAGPNWNLEPVASTAEPCARCGAGRWTGMPARWWVRRRGRRGLSLPELLAMAVAVLVALCACRDGAGPPVVVVDPGPPFPHPGPVLRAAHRLQDGSVLVVLQRETAH